MSKSAKVQTFGFRTSTVFYWVNLDHSCHLWSLTELSCVFQFKSVLSESFWLMTSPKFKRFLINFNFQVVMFLGGFPDSHRRYTPLVCVWFLTTATASMFPLLQKDLLAIPTLALSAFYLILCHFFELFEPVRQALQVPTQKGARPSPKPLNKDQVCIFLLTMYTN